MLPRRCSIFCSNTCLRAPPHVRQLGVPGPAFHGALYADAGAWFHYRNLDVSTLKELARRWRPEVYKGVQKKGKHEALADIYESIDELRHYRDHFLRLD